MDDITKDRIAGLKEMIELARNKDMRAMHERLTMVETSLAALTLLVGKLVERLGKEGIE